MTVEQSGSSSAQKAEGRSRKTSDGKAGDLGSNPARCVNGRLR